MDSPGGPPPQGGNRRPRPRGARRNMPAQNPQLFDDTSNQPYGKPTVGVNAPLGGGATDVEQNNADMQQPSQGYDPMGQQQYGYYEEGGFGGPPQQGYGAPQGQYGQGVYQPPASQNQFPGQQFLQDPMANMAMQYGETFANQGKEYVHKNIEKYVSTSKLKYYFAVDTSYVGKKLGLLLFPYAHSDWSVRYNQDEPVAPRYEVNAPDLYIPVMAFVTYILLAGIVLGTNNRFTPEQLGITSSTALVWLIIEILLLLLIMYILNVTTDLKYLDLLAYCGYKYVGMIMCLLGGLIFQSTGYYLVLLWTSISLALFLVRSLKLAIIPHADADAFTKGSKRRLYMLLTIALSQPVFMWWLTSHLLSA